MTRIRLYYSGILQKGCCVFSVHYIRRHGALICLIIGDINFHHLIVLNRFFLCKVTIFSNAINKYFGGNTLRLCKYPLVLKFSLTNFGIHWWFLACINYIIVMVAELWFSNSFIPSTFISDLNASSFNFVKCLFSAYGNDHIIFLLRSSNMNYTDWFPSIEPSVHS